MRRLLACLLLIAALAPAAAAQTTVGTITGKIVDESGLVLPGVTVTLTGRQGAQTAVTDENGEYRFPGLDPGTYAVKAELEGFTPRLEQALDLGIAKTLTVNFTLRIGGLTESVEVVANAANIDATSAATDTTLSQDLLFGMPLGRQNAAVDLLNAAPGVNTGSAFGGEADGGNALLLDGVDVRDPYAGTAWAFYNFNIIEEVQVGGLGAPAEYGGFNGAIVNTITKSGGNLFSGLFDIRYTNDSLAGDNVDEDLLADNASLEFPNVFTKDFDYTVQLGGPIRTDKAFFFASIQRSEILEDPAGARTLRTRISPRFNFKTTFQPTRTDTIVGMFQWDNYNQTGRSSFLPGALLSTDDQTVQQDSPEWIYNAQYRKVLTPTMFLEAKFTGYYGYFDLDPKIPEPIRYDIETESYYAGGAGYNSKSDRWRNQLNVALSKYAEAYGSHQFKFGVEIERSRVREQFAYTDNVWFYDYGGQPYLAYAYSYDIKGENKRESYFAQDAWRVGRLTMNLGVRLDHIRGVDGNTGETVYTPDLMLAPRLGLVYDLTGKGTSVVKGFYGWYYDQAMVNPYSSGLTGFTDFITYEVLPGDQLVELSADPFPIYRVSEDIEHPRTDEFNISLEQQVRKDVRFSATGIWRQWKNIIASVLPGARWSPIALTSELTGRDFTAWSWANRPDVVTNDDILIRNVDGFAYLDPAGMTIGTANAYKDYKGLMLVLSKALTNRWQAQASYVYSVGKGSIFNDFGDATASSLFQAPSPALINNDGEHEFDRTHEVKAFATYQIPRIDVSVNVAYLGLSGYAFQAYERYPRGGFNIPQNVGLRDINVEPRGSRRNDFRNIIDLRLEKYFSPGFGRLGVFMDVTNLFNSGTISDRQDRYPDVVITGYDQPDDVAVVPFLGPSALVAARQVYFGARWSF